MFESEIVVKYIFEKLISYTITESQRQEVNMKIPDYTFDYVKTLITDTLKMELITCDLDLTEKNIEEQYNSLEDKPRTLYFCSKISGINDYSFMAAPEIARIDRAASTSIKFTKTTREPNLLKQESKVIRNSYATNIKKKESTYPEEIVKGGRIRNRNETMKKEEPKQVDLENIQVYLEPPEITEVRKKKEEEWKKKEEDAKKKILNEKVRQEENNEYVKKQKEFEKKNVTADSNGNPIFIKGVTYGLITDFIMTKHGVAEKEIGNQVKTEKSEAKEVLVITNTKKDEVKNTVPVNSTMANKENSVLVKKDDKKKLGGLLDKGFKPAEMKEYGSEPFSKPLPSAQPAGSNYDFFIPSVGVTIQEGPKQKSGGKDFYTLFNKPSVYDYRQLVRESATHYGTSFLQNSEFPKNEITDKMAQTANQLSLPQIMKKTLKEEKNSLGSQMDSIKVSNKIGSLTTVLDALDQMPEYDKKLEDQHFRSTNSDLFKNKKGPVELEKEKYKESINAELEEIIKFNHSIMKNSLWGQGLMNKPKPNTANKIPVKPDQKELEKEMGKTIVNTKLPRSRHLTKVGKMKK